VCVERDSERLSEEEEEEWQNEAPASENLSLLLFLSSSENFILLIEIFDVEFKPIFCF